MTHGLDDLGWDSSQEELRGASDAKAMASCARIAECAPYLVAPGEECGFRECAWAGRGVECEQQVMVGELVGCEVGVHARDGLKDPGLWYEHYFLPGVRSLRVGKEEGVCAAAA